MIVRITFYMVFKIYLTDLGSDPWIKFRSEIRIHNTVSLRFNMLGNIMGDQEESDQDQDSVKEVSYQGY